MGWRFRRSIKVAPGVRLNVGKSGFTSVSIGGRGGRVNVGKRGVSRTLSLPGTGISHTQRFTGGRSTAPMPVAAPEPDPLDGVDLGRFGIERVHVPPSRAKWLCAVSGAGLLLMVGAGLPVPSDVSALFTGVGLAAIAFAFLLPSQEVKQRQADRVARDQYDAELATRIEEVRASITAAADDPTLETLRGVVALRDQHGLSNREVGADRMSLVEGHIELLDLEKAALASGGLRPIEGLEHVTAPDQCFFVREGVLYDKRGDNDPTGTLYITGERIIFKALEALTVTPWAKVMSVDVERTKFLIQRRDRQTPYIFWMDSVGSALCARFVAINVMANRQSGAAPRS